MSQPSHNGEVTLADENDRPSKSDTFRLWLWLTGMFGLATFTIYRLLWVGHFTAGPVNSSTGRALSVPASLLASLVFAAGLALLTAIAWLHRGRFRVVFRFSRARIVGAAILTALTPIAVFSGVPWLLLPLVIFGFSFTISGDSGLDFRPLLTPLAALMASLFITFPISCLLVAGLRSRSIRFGGYALIWWSAYAFIQLVFGLRKFML